MLGSETLETAVGLVMMFCVLSLVATSLREMIELRLQSRAVQLERGIRELLRDEDGTRVTQALYDHPLISGLFRGTYDPLQQLIKKPGDAWKRLRSGSTLPAYIPKRNFALALMDMAGRGVQLASDGGAALTVARIRAGIADLPSDHLQRAMLVALDTANDDLDQARTNIEHWFDSGMDRVSGWYRKQTQIILFGIGLALAWMVNVDTLQVARVLYHDTDMRAVIVAQAQATVESARQGQDHQHLLTCDPDAGKPKTGVPARLPEGAEASCAQRQLLAMGLPVGWGDLSPRLPDHFDSRSIGRWLASFPWFSIPGWLITAFAVSLGAPFWFDLLNKIMVIRSTVKPHEKSPEEASEDRQDSSTDTAPTVVVQTAAPANPPPAGGEPADFRPRQWAGRTDPDEGML